MPTPKDTRQEREKAAKIITFRTKAKLLTINFEAKLLTTNFDKGRTITEKNFGGQAHEGGHEASARYED
jgi:hypothetical protein